MVVEPFLDLYYLSFIQTEVLIRQFFKRNLGRNARKRFLFESLILAQDERWRCALGMQVERF